MCSQSGRICFVLLIALMGDRLPPQSFLISLVHQVLITFFGTGSLTLDFSCLCECSIYVSCLFSDIFWNTALDILILDFSGFNHHITLIYLDKK
jgi:hypothetical protein